jgi:cytochrome subunit of sulfide dehydrogenase
MRTRLLVAAALLGCSAAIAGLAPALAQIEGGGRYLAANCANCHGTNGVAKGAMPSLAGQKKEYIVEQMRAFRDGKQPATLMHQISKGYTEVQIEAIAEFFARQPAAR